MSRKPTLKPCTATIPLSSVPGKINVEATLSPEIATGTIEGGVKGVTFNLHLLRRAIDVAIDQLYYDVDLQVVSAPGVPLMLVLSEESCADGPRKCVVLAGKIPEDGPRTPRDAVEARA
jgi:hypothetical protein